MKEGDVTLMVTFGLKLEVGHYGRLEAERSPIEVDWHVLEDGPCTGFFG